MASQSAMDYREIEGHWELFAKAVENLGEEIKAFSVGRVATDYEIAEVGKLLDFKLKGPGLHSISAINARVGRIYSPPPSGPSSTRISKVTQRRRQSLS